MSEVNYKKLIQQAREKVAQDQLKHDMEIESAEDKVYALSEALAFERQTTHSLLNRLEIQRTLLERQNVQIVQARKNFIT